MGCGLGEFRLGWLYSHNELAIDPDGYQLPRDMDAAKTLYLRAAQHGYRDRLGCIQYLIYTGEMPPM